MKEINSVFLKGMKNYIERLKKKPQNNVFDDFPKRFEERLKVKERMASSDYYVTWLAGFIKSHGRIDSESILYNDFLSEVDQRNLNDLRLFFEVVENYADEEGVVPRMVNDGAYKDISYLVKCKDFYFVIGITVGQGAIVHCEKTGPKKDRVVDLTRLVDVKKKIKKRTD